MKKFKSIVIPTYFKFIQMSIMATKFTLLYILAIYINETLSWMI